MGGGRVVRVSLAKSVVNPQMRLFGIKQVSGSITVAMTGGGAICRLVACTFEVKVAAESERLLMDYNQGWAAVKYKIIGVIRRPSLRIQPSFLLYGAF